MCVQFTGMHVTCDLELSFELRVNYELRDARIFMVGNGDCIRKICWSGNDNEYRVYNGNFYEEIGTKNLSPAFLHEPHSSANERFRP